MNDIPHIENLRNKILNLFFHFDNLLVNTDKILFFKQKYTYNIYY